MKKPLLTLLVLPIMLTSCSTNRSSFDALKARIDTIEDSAVYPYYKVIGSIDFNNEYMEVEYVFKETPKLDTFVPFARYNDGFYNETADNMMAEEDVVIFGMASHSYWLRAPMRLNKENFYKEMQVGSATIENKSCGHYILQHIITSYLGETGSTNPSKNQCYYELLADGGFAIGGDKVHTKVNIDNFPLYPDENYFRPVEEGGYGEWDPDDPLPLYYKNTVNAKVNIRFEYNKDGWLVKESMTSVDYNFNVASTSQVSLEAVYSYQFE